MWIFPLLFMRHGPASLRAANALKKLPTAFANSRRQDDASHGKSARPEQGDTLFVSPQPLINEETRALLNAQGGETRQFDA